MDVKGEGERKEEGKGDIRYRGIAGNDIGVYWWVMEMGGDMGMI